MRTIAEQEERRQKMSSRTLRPVSLSTVPGSEPCERLLDPHITCLECDLSANRAIALLDASGLTSAPVVDDNSVLVGVVTIRSLVSMMGREDLEVEDAMAMNPVTATPRTSIAEVAQLMAKNDLQVLPIVTDDGHLLGIVSAMDVVKWLAQRIES